LQKDVRKVAVPLFAEAFHPGIRRLADLARSLRARRELKLVEMERWSTEGVLLDIDYENQKPGLPGWDVLRLIGGEVAELFALAEGPELSAESPVAIAGQFVQGGLFQVCLQPFQAGNRYRLAVVTSMGRTELLFPQGFPGPAQLTFRD